MRAERVRGGGDAGSNGRNVGEMNIHTTVILNGKVDYFG